MKSILLFLAMWGAAFGPLWYAAHRMFLAPGDWIGALIVSLFFALGINGFRKAWLERKDAILLARPEGQLRDGRRVAIAGTIEPQAEPLSAPLSGRACLAYDYEIGHRKAPGVQLIGKTSGQSQMSSEVIDYGGYGLAPSVIVSEGRQVHLMAFPGLEGFPRSATEDLAIDRARSYVGATTFEQQSLWSGIGDINKLATDRSGSVRKDWRMTSHEGVDESFLREQILPVGAKACVIGRYSERESAIVPEAGWSGVRVIHGTRDEGLSFLRDKFTGVWIAAVIFILVPGPALFGVLSYRERYQDAHGKDSVASGLKDLAYHYLSQRKFAEAEPLYKRSLEIKERELGPNHIVVADSLDDLGELYAAQGRFADAEPLFLRALAIRDKALGPAHPDLEKKVKHLADLYDQQGLYAKAAPLHGRWLALLEKTLGPDNPGVARSMIYVADRYVSQGRLAQAEPLYTRALAMLGKALGPQDEDVAGTREKLAALYRKTGRAPAAAELEDRAKGIEGIRK